MLNLDTLFYILLGGWILGAIWYGLVWWHRRKMSDSELVDDFYYELNR